MICRIIGIIALLFCIPFIILGILFAMGAIISFFCISGLTAVASYVCGIR